MTADIDPASGTMSVYSPVLLANHSSRIEMPIFWTGNLADAQVTPIPPVRVDKGARATRRRGCRNTGGLPGRACHDLADGAPVFIVYRALEGDLSLVTMAIASGDVSLLPVDVGDIRLQPVMPQWSLSGTILFQGADGPLLTTLGQDSWRK